MRTFLTWIGGLLLAAPLTAQTPRWHVTIEAGELRFHGTSADTSSEGAGSFRPYRPTAIGLRLEKGGAVRMGIGLLYGSGPAALTGPEVTIAAETDPLTLLELAPTMSMQLTRVGSGSLRLAGGPLLDRWGWSVAPTRWRVGGELSAQLAAPLGAGTALSFRAGLARSASVFDEADLPATFERRASWRSSIALGVAVRR